jgi:23S rRNA (cytidine1920-2'-O)/16S rRNA (cytidine1409-2'-O)-methyltransferase
VVRNPALQDEVCRRLQAWFAAQPGWQVLGLVESPILGPRGNREFLLAARRDPS